MAISRIEKDLDTILSLEDKKKLLKEIHQEELLEIFKKDYIPKYTPAINKKAPLDQQLSFSISQEEKDYLSKELLDIRRLGPGISISSYVRNQAVVDIDLTEWSRIALEELKKLNSPEYDISYLNKQKKVFLKLIEDTEDEEDAFRYNKELKKIKDNISQITKTSFKRKYRLSGRVTFQEAQIIRWRAARLSLSIADYMRYVMFNYLPGSIVDNSLSLNERKRFYVSILDVQRNGWGNPPQLDECPNCRRYIKEIQSLKEQLGRYKTFLESEK